MNMKNAPIGNRLDRIEQNLEVFSDGMPEPKESQKKTDERLIRTDEQPRKTIKKQDDIGYQLADLGLVQGEVPEDVICRNVKGLSLPMAPEIATSLSTKNRWILRWLFTGAHV
jgi:hypothetical protein